MDERNFLYMFYGFLAVWLILAGYVAVLAGRERRLEKELGNLRRLLEDRGKEAS